MTRLRPLRTTLLIMLGISLWGGFHTWGAVRTGSDWSDLKGLVIAACVALFLGFWSLMLVIRRWRLSTEAERRAATPETTTPAVMTKGE